MKLKVKHPTVTVCFLNIISLLNAIQAPKTSSGSNQTEQIYAQIELQTIKGIVINKFKPANQTSQQITTSIPAPQTTLTAHNEPSFMSTINTLNITIQKLNRTIQTLNTTLQNLNSTIKYSQFTTQPATTSLPLITLSTTISLLELIKTSSTIHSTKISSTTKLTTSTHSTTSTETILYSTNDVLGPETTQSSLNQTMAQDLTTDRQIKTQNTSTTSPVSKKLTEPPVNTFISTQSSSVPTKLESNHTTTSPTSTTTSLAPETPLANEIEATIDPTFEVNEPSSLFDQLLSFFSRLNVIGPIFKTKIIFNFRHSISNLIPEQVPFNKTAPKSTFHTKLASQKNNSSEALNSTTLNLASKSFDSTAGSNLTTRKDLKDIISNSTHQITNDKTSSVLTVLVVIFSVICLGQLLLIIFAFHSINSTRVAEFKKNIFRTRKVSSARSFKDASKIWNKEITEVFKNKTINEATIEPQLQIMTSSSNFATRPSMERLTPEFLREQTMKL